MAREKHVQLSSTKRLDHVTGYLMILPSLALLAIFVLVPLVMAVQKSFYDWRLYLDSIFVGFKNFRMVLTNPLFRMSLTNIGWFVIVIVPAQFVLTFLFAHVLKGMNQRFGAFIKTAIYVPTVISGVVASVIFLFIFHYQGGILNSIVRQLGGKRIGFLAEPLLSKVSISITSLWMGFGYSALVMFAGLQNVPQSYYEAAEVDGAGKLAKMLRITLPSMKNIFILILINLMTGTLQMFDLPFMMFNGTSGAGPVNSTLTPMVFIYNNFKSTDYSLGYTVSAALLLMIVIGMLNAIVFTVIGSQKAQDE